MSIYISLDKPIKSYIKGKQVLGENSKEILPCEIISLCFYKGEAVTFQVLLEDGEVFSYIPFMAIVHNGVNNLNLTLKQSCFLNAPSTEVSMFTNNLPKEVSFYEKELKKWYKGEYITTIDFYNDNELLNLILIEEDGVYSFILSPYHKMKFKRIDKIERSFNNFKKQREDFIV